MIFGQPLQHLAEVTSTNDLARNWAREGAPEGATVWADSQTDGRGRRGRSWASPSGKGLYVSIILRPDPLSTVLPMVTMLLAVAAAEAVHQQTQLPVATKWPNDILINGRKIGGVLCQAELPAGGKPFVIAGLGLNLNFEAADLPARPVYPATSLLLETGREWAVEPMLRLVLEQVQRLWRDADEVPASFASHCVQLGQKVTVTEENQQYEGIAKAIEPDGALLVLTAAGLRRVIAGDVA